MATTFSMQEETTGVYRATVTAEDGTLLPASSLSTLTLTLYVIGAGGTSTYIRQDQDVLNNNGVTVYNDLQTDTLADGTEVTYNLKWTISSTDTAIQNSALSTERHIALFEWSWSSTKKGKHEVVLAVKNLREV